ncbi:retrovirus-related pol polyprotein from transposon TNT 1-94 [Tanacetum coccineum]
MILESVESGPLIWPLIEENGVTRPKKYSELSVTEALQADCDIKETNIILQGLPPEVYALVSNHKVAKELWERIKLLMKGTSLTKQEKECKLYDEFDKQQATINNGRVTLEPIQGRQTSVAAGTSRTYTQGASGNNFGKQRTVIYYNCKEEGHMSKQCNKPKRKRDDSWFKDNVLLVQAQVAVQNSNSSAQKDDLILSMIEQLKTQVVHCTKTNLENKSVNDTLTDELERYKEQVKVLKEGQIVDLKSEDNVSDSCAQSVEIDHPKRTLSEHLKEK